MLIRWDRNGQFLFARATEGATPLQGLLANWREIEDEQLVVMKVEAMRRGTAILLLSSGDEITANHNAH